RLKAAGVMNAATPVGTDETTIEITGGDAPAVAPFSKKLEITPEETRFGVERYEIRPENANGEPETQAGAHPFQLTSIFNSNQVAREIAPQQSIRTLPTAAALPK